MDLRVTFRDIIFVAFVLAFDADDVAPMIFFHVTNNVCYNLNLRNRFCFSYFF